MEEVLKNDFLKDLHQKLKYKSNINKILFSSFLWLEYNNVDSNFYYYL
jgi:hypothetical protein